MEIYWKLLPIAAALALSACGGKSSEAAGGDNGCGKLNADEICVMFEGEIVERGVHEELLKKNGYYKRLNDMQSLG